MNDLRRTTRAAAFSLIEVVLAIGLIVGLTAAVLAFHRHVERVRGRLIASVEDVASRSAAMDRLSRELESAVVYRFLGIGMEGEADTLTFVTAALPARSVWVPPDVTETPPPPQADLHMVTWRLRTWEDEYGEVHVAGLERSVRRTPGVREAEEGQGIETALISDAVKFLNVRCWDGGGWIGSWSGGDLPEAVEITLGPRALPEDYAPEDYPYDVRRRVVYVPAGRRGADEGGVRGGPGAGGGR